MFARLMTRIIRDYRFLLRLPCMRKNHMAITCMHVAFLRTKDFFALKVGFDLVASSFKAFNRVVGGTGKNHFFATTLTTK